MADIMDFLGPMMPRRPAGRPTLPVPHPASGSAPDLLQILAEAAATHPPPPDVIPPEAQAHVQNTINNPTPENVPPEALQNAILMMINAHGGHGSFPGLSRALVDHLAHANMSVMDSASSFDPTLARLLLQGTDTPSMMHLMALDSGEEPKLSSYWKNLSATDNPQQTIKAANEFSRRLQHYSPLSRGGNADAIAGELAAGNELRPGDLNTIDSAASDQMEELHRINDNIRMLALASQKDGAARAQIINEVVGRMGPDYMHRLMAAMNDAVAESGIGGGRKVSTLDPASMRSLAPDINPGPLGYGIQGENRGSNQPPQDLQLLFRLMGLERTPPRRNV